MAVEDGPTVVLGAGYAGVKLAHELSRLGRGTLPIVLVDRHPIHVVRTELYQVGELAAKGSDVRKWAIPIDRVVGRRNVTYREGTVERIDLDAATISVDGATLPYRSLAICLGNVPSYYGVPGAPENTHQLYGLFGAMRLANALSDVERASPSLPAGERPRVVVVGGGSTGTEVAAEIATADWRRITGVEARPPIVTLVCGALPFLDGFDPALVAHARRQLYDAGVVLHEGKNVRSVASDRLALDGGDQMRFEVAVWAAGIEAPGIVRALPGDHGRGGRLIVDSMLELRDHPGVFAVGDVAQVKDPKTGVLVPATAQAAIAEARVAARNLLARSRGEELTPFVYRERGMIVALGERRAAGKVSRVTIWGSPAALLKSLAQEEYRLVTEHRKDVPG